MRDITGKKIFVLYPDEELREIFYGPLRNQFEVYYIYDYEKIKPLVEYYPGSIIIINLINNDLDWLPEEINEAFNGVSAEVLPETVALYDNAKPLCGLCTRSIHYQGDKNDFKAELNRMLVELGGKGRRDFVRYGGSDDNIASMKIVTDAGEYPSVVHDISVSGLSCSTSQADEISVDQKIRVVLSLNGKSVEIDAQKILERNFGSVIHILKFSEPMPGSCKNDLLHFIYSSLDSKMNEFIKKLSN